MSDKVYGLLSGTELVWLKEQGKVLGTGSYGTVYSYKTSDTTTHAVKLIRNKNKRGEFSITNDTLVEVSTLLTIPKHPNIIELSDIFVAGDVFGLVLEEADDNVENIIKANKLPISGIELTFSIKKNICYQFLRGVRIIINAGIINRDYKPANLLLSEREGCFKVVITDFGLSIDNNCYRDVNNAAKAGTPLYMSPELYLGGIATSKSDIWSVCLTLYYILLGQRLITGINGSNTIIYEILGLFGTAPEDKWENITESPQYNNIIKPNLANLGSYDSLAKHIERDSTSHRKIDDEELDETTSFLENIIVLDPQDRPTIEELLDDGYFDDVRPGIESTRCLNEGVVEDESCNDLIEERLFSSIPDYTRTYENSVRRKQIIDRIIEYKDLFSISDRCLILAITLADRHLARIEIDKETQNKQISRTRLLTPEESISPLDRFSYFSAFAVGLYVASVFLKSGYEFTIDNVKDIIKVASITQKQIYSFSIQILAAVGFKLHNTTSYDLLSLFTRSYENSTSDAAFVYLYLVQYDYRLLTQFDNEIIALMCLYLATEYSREELRQDNELDDDNKRYIVNSIKNLIVKIWLKDNKLNIRELYKIKRNKLTASIVIKNTPILMKELQLIIP